MTRRKDWLVPGSSFYIFLKWKSSLNNQRRVVCVQKALALKWPKWLFLQLRALVLPLDLILGQKCLSGEINNSLSLENKLVLLGHYDFTSKIQAACFWTTVYFSAFFFFFNGDVVFQSVSCVWLFVTPWTAAHQASLSFIISQSFLKLMSIDMYSLVQATLLPCPFQTSLVVCFLQK